MAILTVIAPFGSYTRGQTITDAVTVAGILAGPDKIYVVGVADGSPTSPGSGDGTTTPPAGTGLTLADVDGEIATALTAKGLPPGSTVPGLIAAAGTGSGVSASQSIVNALIFG